MSLQRSTSSLPPVSAIRIESIAPRGLPATGVRNNRITDLWISPRGRGTAAVAQLEIEVTPIDEDTESLTQDEYRIAYIERIGKQQHAAPDRKEPEGDRHHHFSRAFGGNPLHHEAHGEHELRHITEQDPPLELGHKDFVQIAAHRL